MRNAWIRSPRTCHAWHLLEIGPIMQSPLSLTWGRYILASPLVHESDSST